MPAEQQALLEGIRRRLQTAPLEPGVYRWLGDDGVVLYVGKAKQLRHRLKSYLTAGQKLGPWKEAMLRAVRDVEWTVVPSELEALVLETNLIKQFRPKYNVLMKDDKSYVYVRVTVQDAYPRVEVVRQLQEDGAKYFGPKTNAAQVHEALAVLRRLYPFRTCKMTIEPRSPAKPGIPLEVETRHRDRPVPCLDAHMQQCTAPCVGRLTPESYQAQCIEPVLRFWRGDPSAVVTALHERMAKAVAERQFELAAQSRDALRSIEALGERQVVSDASGEDCDAVGVALLTSRAQVVVLQKRGGKLIGEQPISLSGQPTSVPEVLATFLPQFYADVPDLPPRIFVSELPDDAALLTTWLTEKAGRKVELRVPERGDKTQLLSIAQRNAEERVRQQEAKWEAEARNAEQAGAELQSVLGLASAPQRIECYDISHLGGTETVGSMVVFVGGKPKREHYRSFTVHELARGDVDDYRSLREVLRRRLRYLTGGLKGELARLAEVGVVVRKARKADQPALTELRAAEGLSTAADAYKTTVVAERGEVLIGMARLCTHEGNLVEVRGVWVAQAERGQKLGQLLLRFLLSSLKKGKAYLLCDPALQAYYAAVGFRPMQDAADAVLKLRAIHVAEQSDVTSCVPLLWQASDHKDDASLSTKPDILLIDGGLGQLHAVEAELEASGLQGITLLSLAKREEEVFLRGQPRPIALTPGGSAHILLRRLRDEAHRSANRHRESRSTARMLASDVLQVPGIGEGTMKKLLQRFGSLPAAHAASDDELATILTKPQLIAFRSVVTG